MKTLFIPAKKIFKINKLKISKISKKLPKNLAIAYSVQYKFLAEETKNSLKSKNITSFMQVLGCSKPNFPKNTKAVLLLSDGKFHGTALAYETKLPVFIFDGNNLAEIQKKEISNFEKKQKSSYLKFLHADRIGILISTKPGQENLQKALDFKKKLQNKKSYQFICNNISTGEFENFPEIQSWVNTACPRFDMDDTRIVNVSKPLPD